MTTDTRAALLRRILDDPQDDGVRLVYADACEEEGDVDRATFIRIQLRIADLGRELMSDDDCGDERCPGCVERRGLRRRESELLKAACVPGGKSNYEWWFSPFDEKIRYVTGSFGSSSERTLNWEYHRGFVHGVWCRFETWTGGVCGRCGGWKYLGAPAPGQHGWIGAPDCPDCAGTGTTPGVGTAVVACHPVEVVRVSDREPYHRGGQWSWYDETKVSLGSHPKSDLPSSVFRLLPRSECGEDNHGVYYPTEAAANAALSAALLSLASKR
jgi:uncharacterized protein (TIGR02996 family)